MIIDTALNDGTPICIRPVNAADEERLKEGVARLSPRSRYLRFFSGMRALPQNVVDKLIDVDGHDHIAWGALRRDDPKTPALGIVHAFREEGEPDVAQYSVAVIDDYHGLGAARLLTAVLLLDCQRQGYRELLVHILAENAAGRAFARSLGAERQRADGNVIELDIGIAEAIEILRRDEDVPGLAAVFAAFCDPSISASPPAERPAAD
ncbi:MAG: GNAT family N-acetyltransferase [Erythrobacter sp.]|nr:GNAT family N-acetyltransferase [Erythrobacter sp.]